MKLVIVATHPIQHFCPQYRSLASLPGVELTVVFHSLMGVEAYRDPGFDADISWGKGLLEGFEYQVLQDGQRLGKVLNQLSPDCVIVYGYTSPIARKTWVWALKHPSKKVAYISDSEFRHDVPKTLKNRVKFAIVLALFRRVNAFLTVGDANEEYYAAHRVDPSRLVRMHFPIDPALPATSTAAAPDRRAELEIAENTLVVLNVGKFLPMKRQKDLIDAIKLVPDAHLVLAGSGVHLDECKRAAAGLDNVTFLGFQQPKDLAAYYSMSDVYVHPSTYDPHPLAVSEAAAAGLALVVSDKTGSWGASDDVIPDETGYVVPAGDIAAIAKVLQKFVFDRELATTMGGRAHENSRGFQAIAHGGFIDALRQRVEVPARE